jgi:hypothetical protein
MKTENVWGNTPDQSWVTAMTTRLVTRLAFFEITRQNSQRVIEERHDLSIREILKMISERSLDTTKKNGRIQQIKIMKYINKIQNLIKIKGI